MFMALVTSLVVLFYYCVTADIFTKLLQQCFLIFIVPWIYLGNSQVSVYRTIGPTLVCILSSIFTRLNQHQCSASLIYGVLTVPGFGKMRVTGCEKVKNKSVVEVYTK